MTLIVSVNILSISCRLTPKDDTRSKIEVPRDVQNSKGQYDTNHMRISDTELAFRILNSLVHTCRVSVGAYIRNYCNILRVDGGIHYKNCIMRDRREHCIMRFDNSFRKILYFSKDFEEHVTLYMY